MKRWTDGMRWSKSRVEGQFLVYRRIEAEEPLPIELEPSKRRRLSSVDSVSASSTIGDDDTLNEDDRFVTEKLYQSHEKIHSITKSGSKALNDSILCKKTFAISLEGSICHVVMIVKKICYYTKDDIMAGLLKSPSAMEIFKDVKLPASFLNPSNFRLHPKSNAPLKHQINTLQPLQSSDDQGEYRYEGNNADRFVTVNRLGDPQSLRISIGKDFKVVLVDIGFLSNYYACVQFCSI